MSQFNEEWKVAPHGPVERLAAGLVTVAGEIAMPLGRFPRRMTVAALSGGRSAIWSAIPLAEPAMAEIEALGTPSVLIVPGIAHRLDAPSWLRRYPQMKVLCAPGARDKVAEAVPVADTTGSILADDEVHFETVPGVGETEGALLVRRGDGTTLVVNDIIANVQHPHGLGAKVMARVMGFGVDGPRVPWLGRMMFIKDSAAFAAGLRRWGAIEDLARIVVSHGDVIEEAPREVLATIAAELE